MAPIQNIPSCSLPVPLLFSSVFSQKPTTTSTNAVNARCPFVCWERELPVIPKGSFFGDSFFEKLRTCLNQEFRFALNEWDEEELKVDAWFRRAVALHRRDRGRRFRICTERPNNQAFTITTNDFGFKILVNVGGLNSEEIRIRTISNKISVEGRVNKIITRNYWPSASKDFHYQFLLPKSANMATFTSVLSSDGFLIISAPTVVDPLEIRSPLRLIPEALRFHHELTNLKNRRLQHHNIFENHNHSMQRHSMPPHLKIIYPDGQLHDTKQLQEDVRDKKVKQIINEMRPNTITFRDERKVLDRCYCHLGKSTGTETLRKAEEASFKSEIGSRSYRMERSPSFFSPVQIPLLWRKEDSAYPTLNSTGEDFQEVLEILSSKRKNKSVGKADEVPTTMNKISEVIKLEDQFRYVFSVDIQDFLPDEEIFVESAGSKELVVRCYSYNKSTSNLRNSFVERFPLPGDAKFESAKAFVITSEGFVIITVAKKNQMVQVGEDDKSEISDIGSENESGIKSSVTMTTGDEQWHQQSPVANEVSNVDGKYDEFHGNSSDVAKSVSPMESQAFVHHWVSPKCQNRDITSSAMERENRGNTDSTETNKADHEINLKGDQLMKIINKANSSLNIEQNGCYVHNGNNNNVPLQNLDSDFKDTEQISEKRNGLRLKLHSSNLNDASSPSNSSLQRFDSPIISQEEGDKKDLFDSEQFQVQKESTVEAAANICPTESGFSQFVVDDDGYDDDGDNDDTDDDSSDASTVIGFSSCSGTYDVTTSPPETPKVNYTVTLAESPCDSQNSFTNWGATMEKDTAFSNDIGRQICHQSSTLSIHTVDDSDVNCDESCNSSVHGLSSYSSLEDYPTLNDDALSMLNLRGPSKMTFNDILWEESDISRASSEDRSIHFNTEKSTSRHSVEEVRQGSVSRGNKVEEWISRSMHSGTHGKSSTPTYRGSSES